MGKFRTLQLKIEGRKKRLREMSRKVLEDLLAQINLQLSSEEIKGATPPRGSLVCRTSKSGERYYLQQSHGSGDSRSFSALSLGDSTSPDVISFKINRIRYIQKRRLQKNQRLIGNLLNHYVDHDTWSVLQELPSSYGGLECVELFGSQNEWADDDYVSNPFAHQIAHIASDGTMVRSKSELVIYELLLSNSIPFRYEAQLKLLDLDNTRINRYPDFTFQLADRSYLYWEHLGLLRNKDYLISFAEKTALYQHNDILPGKNLILTSEGPDGGLDIEAVSRIIHNDVIPRL